jgi:hypothetical protein
VTLAKPRPLPGGREVATLLRTRNRFRHRNPAPASKPAPANASDAGSGGGAVGSVCGAGAESVSSYVIDDTPHGCAFAVGSGVRSA